MPWKPFKVNDEYCVFRIDKDGNRFGDRLGCHATRARANQQVAALNASEDKDKLMDETNVNFVQTKDNLSNVNVTPETTVSNAIAYTKNDNGQYALPLEEKELSMFVTDMDDLDAIERMEERAEEVEKVVSVVPEIARNIVHFVPENEQSSKLTKLADDFKTRIGAIMSNLAKGKRPMAKAVPKVKSKFMVWKDDKSGLYRWFGRYSNKYRDDDSPPEIISSKSHERFVEMIEKGTYPMPELQIWHEPTLSIANTEWVAWDSEGFALATGTFHKEMGHVAEILMEAEDMSMSHGMPSKSIKRDSSDKTIITEHQTIEISVLPGFAAANRWTDFIVLEKEANMPIPNKKREELKQSFGLDDNVIDAIEAANTQTAAKNAQLGIEFKDIAPTELTPEPEAEPVVVTPDKEEVPAEEAEVPAVEAPVEVETEEAEIVETPAEETPVEADPDVEVADAEEPVSREEVAEAMEVMGEEIVEEVKTAMVAVMQDFSKDIESLQKTANEKVRESLERTPKGPKRLSQMIRRTPILGGVQTAKETADDTEGGSVLLRSMKGDGGESFLEGIRETITKNQEQS